MTNEIDKAPGYCGICGPLSEGKGRCELHDSRYGYDPASGADHAVEIKYQLKGEGVEVLSITDKPDPKNVRGNWFNVFGLDSAQIDSKLLECLTQENKRMDRTIADQACEIRVLRQACKAAGDEIRELHAQRKPEKHGAYWLTFPEYGPSAGMYWAGGLALLFLAACFAWVIK